MIFAPDYLMSSQPDIVLWLSKGVLIYSRKNIQISVLSDYFSIT